MKLEVKLFAVFCILWMTDRCESSPTQQRSQLSEIKDDPFITLAFINLAWNDESGIKRQNDHHESSKYGMGKVIDIEGLLIHVADADNSEDHFGCSQNLKDSFGHPLHNITTPWIALVMRGVCDFDTKIMNVFRAKAVGVIVYNNVSGSESADELIHMAVTNEKLLESNITSVFTSLSKGEQMASKIDTFKHVIVSIKAGTSSLNPLFVFFLFLIFLAVLMLLMLILMQRFLYFQIVYNKAKDMLKKIV